jgi:hypothetical protein
VEPDPDVEKKTIDPAVAKKLTEHIRLKWKNGCPMCGARAWELSGFTSVPIKKDLGPNIVLAGPNLPSAAIVCRNCGNTVLVNLIVAGVMAKDG